MPSKKGLAHLNQCNSCWFCHSEHLGDVQPHLLQSNYEEHVEAAPAIDEYLGEP
jgi:hypothetical protein